MAEPQPRGFLPDALTEAAVILLKAPAYLRLTYEIRIAAYMAKTSGRGLILSVPAQTRFSPELAAFLAQHHVTVERPAQ